MIGPSTGKSNQIKPVESPDIAVINIASSIHPEVTFPNRRNDSEMIFAKCPTISRSPRNIEITISNAFTNIYTGKSIYFGRFPLSNGI